MRPQCDAYFPTRPGQSAVYLHEPDAPARAARTSRARAAPEQRPALEAARAPEAGWRVACTAAADMDGDVRRRELVVTPPGQVRVRLGYPTLENFFVLCQGSTAHP